MTDSSESTAATCPAAMTHARRSPLPGHAFLGIDPEARLFPPPVVSVLPYLTAKQLRWHSARQPYFLTKPHRFLRNARSALALIVSRLQFSPAKILVPGYICKSVVEPLIWSGNEPVFYDLNDDLSVNEADFEDKLQVAGAAIVTHFFGFAQPIDRLVEMCRRHNVLVIEDCAHAFLGEYQGAPLGSFGDFSIASSVKFCPGINGGFLIDNRPGTDLCEDLPASPVHLRSALSVLASAARSSFQERFTESFDQPVPEPPPWRHLRLHELESCPDTEGRYEWLKPEEIDQPGDWISYRLLLKLDYDLMRRQRRSNFCRYLEAAADIPGCRPIITKLPDGCVPYMFPLYIDDHETVFRALKYRGIPIWRWEQQHATAPALGKRYGPRLLHLPCHQVLEVKQLDNIIEAIRDTLEHAPKAQGATAGTMGHS